MNIILKSILILNLFFVGVAFAAPTEIEQDIEYKSSRNAMAAYIMNWYGSLISTDEQVSFLAVGKRWHEYRVNYPQNITALQITSTDLTRLGRAELNTYQFIVNTLINNQIGRDVFVFYVSPFTLPKLTSISRSNNVDTDKLASSTFNRAHYKKREFSYAWISFLDGVQGMHTTMNSNAWLEQAEYKVIIGSQTIVGTVESTLLKRQQYLVKGSHTLRALDVTEVEGKAGFFVLDLTLEWKGRNNKDKAVLAKIHQQINYQIQENGDWKIISIEERHLLPDIAPWVGLLC